MQFKNFSFFKNKKFLRFLKVLLLLALPASIAYNECSHQYRLEKFGKFTKAEITGIRSGHKSHNYYEYQYKDGTGKMYKDSDPLGIPRYNIFIGKYFFVIYNRYYPEEHEVLITEDHYKRFNLVYPDSLFWVKEYEWLF